MYMHMRIHAHIHAHTCSYAYTQVRMKGQDHTFVVLHDVGHDAVGDSPLEGLTNLAKVDETEPRARGNGRATRRIYFGRVVGCGRRELVNK